MTSKTKLAFQGTSGRALVVRTNSFPVTQLPSKEFFQYDLHIFSAVKLEKDDSDDLKEITLPRRRDEIIDRLQTRTAPDVFQPRALFDGNAILFACGKPLKFSGGGDSGNFDVNMSDRPPQAGSPPRGLFRVRLTRVSSVKPKDVLTLIQGGIPTTATATAVNLLQLLIRQAAHNSHPHNKNSYFSHTDSEPLGGGLRVHRGFFQSMRPTLGIMTVNIDVSVAAMWDSKLVHEAVIEYISGSSNRRVNLRDCEFKEGAPQLKQITNHFKGLEFSVRTDPKPRRHRIKTVIAFGGLYKFSKGAREVTVAQHYAETYNIQLAFPNFPGIIEHSSGGKISVFPAELCTIKPGQIYKKRIPNEFMDKVGTFAKRTPQERLTLIRQGISSRGGGQQLAPPTLTYEQSDYLRNAGLKISKEPMAIKGRVLPTPDVVYGNNRVAQVRDGAWNVLRQQLSKPMTINCWAVVNFERNLDRNLLSEGIKQLATCCKALGMKIMSDPYLGNGSQGVIQSLKDAVTKAITAAKSQRITLLICILPKNAADLKLEIKRFCEVGAKIITQCLRENKVRGAKDQYWNNVAIKINARLGGENSVARSSSMQQLYATPTMVIGIDVGHAGAGNDNRPSVSSLVWSHDMHVSRYVAFSRVQQPRQEKVEHLQAMVEEALKQFGRANKFAPVRLLVYRDGLSEGEYDKAGADEIKQIHDAINKVWIEMKMPEQKKPRLTFIVVGKRHHVRFFPEKSQDGDRSGNCPAGFVADEGIAHPSDKICDFFLQSHAGLLGTSRPSHYIVLRDDNWNNNANLLQEISFGLCHVYAKATRSVSIPAPVYYADLVCARGEYYFDPELRFADDSASATSGGTGGNKKSRELDLTKWERGFKGQNVVLSTAGGPPSMYFL